MRKILTLVALVFLLAPVVAQSPTLTLVPPAAADTSFQVNILVDNLAALRGMEFIVVADTNVARLIRATGVGQLAGISVTTNENGKVVIYSPTKILSVSGNILVLTFEARGDPQEFTTILLTESLISDGTQTLAHNVVDASITLSECVNHPNSHTGGGAGIPGTSCACDIGTNLVISPTTQRWSCQVENVEDLFEDAQDCSEGGIPIYNTGYCCIENYQLNPQFNNYDDLLGKPTEACTVIPNQEPIANIFQTPPSIRIGETITFSSVGSIDLDGNIVEYKWDFGDGSTSTVQTPSHVYQSIKDCPAETCTVSLMVTDDDGADNMILISLALVLDPNFRPSIPFCGNNVTETNETCDGLDSDICENGCAMDCTCKEVVDVEDIDVGDTLAEGDINELNLEEGENEVDGSVVTLGAGGAVTDVRSEDSAPATAACGNGICEAGEQSRTCLQDCHLGDGVCQKSLGETSSTVPKDCRKSFVFIILPILLLSLLGGGAFIAKKKGWISLGPIMHKDQQGPSGGVSFDLNRAAEAHQVQKPHGDTDKLINYIQSTRAQGFSFSQVKDSLLKRGWDESDIDAAFSHAG